MYPQTKNYKPQSKNKSVNVVIETGRLLLRTFTLEDAELVYKLNKDPEVTRFTGDPIRDKEHAKEVLEKSILPQYALNNFGRWAVHTKPGLEFIGWCGLKFRPERNEIDLGYRLMRSAWGRGYATEAARACLDHGFKTLHLPRIVGHSMPSNHASVRVLENCGMKYVGEEIVDGHPAVTYEAFNPFIR
jgi:ribosomal-protein-alanine N-acetyltransferase